MEREFNFADGTPGETGASTDLKQFYLLSSEPAVAGGLWRFAPLPGFSFLLLNPIYLLLSGLSISYFFIGQKWPVTTGQFWGGIVVSCKR
ncbi:MAG: hypothetical protein KZQ84_12545 [Candidatus Thiodiazotropha sp. (ex Lucinoma borealis)]|nr:hypothetical protein [Candidatus Thiodiazotropha sp. (ex Lucinoma borealis)]